MARDAERYLDSRKPPLSKMPDIFNSLKRRRVLTPCPCRTQPSRSAAQLCPELGSRTSESEEKDRVIKQTLSIRFAQRQPDRQNKEFSTRAAASRFESLQIKTRLSVRRTWADIPYRSRGRPSNFDFLIFDLRFLQAAVSCMHVSE